MLKSLKDWYNSYGSLELFLEHKLTHFIAGYFFSTLILILSHRSPKGILIALLGTLLLAVGKEIADHIESEETISSSIYDVIVTVLGSVLAVMLIFVG